jgi:membrane-associated phospholipid phosphatase
MGASRIYFMVHYASDVFGGILLGSGVAVISFYFIRWLKYFPRLQKLITGE